MATPALKHHSSHVSTGTEIYNAPDATLPGVLPALRSYVLVSLPQRSAAPHAHEIRFSPWYRGYELSAVPVQGIRAEAANGATQFPLQRYCLSATPPSTPRSNPDYPTQCGKVFLLPPLSAL